MHNLFRNYSDEFGMNWVTNIIASGFNYVTLS